MSLIVFPFSCQIICPGDSGACIKEQFELAALAPLPPADAQAAEAAPPAVAIANKLRPTLKQSEHWPAALGMAALQAMRALPAADPARVDPQACWAQARERFEVLSCMIESSEFGFGLAQVFPKSLAAALPFEALAPWRTKLGEVLGGLLGSRVEPLWTEPPERQSAIQKHWSEVFRSPGGAHFLPIDSSDLRRVVVRLESAAIETALSASPGCLAPNRPPRAL
jgi:hypothetical protein